MPSAKPKIENIYVHTGGVGGQASVHWTIGDRRFHVWMRQGFDHQPEDVVHSNPVTPKEKSLRDEHRSLDRTCKAQTEIWTEVWAFVREHDLIAKCRKADRQKRDLDKRTHNLEIAIARIEQEALSAFRRGDHVAHAAAFEGIYTRWLLVSAELRSLPALQDEAA